MGFDIHEQMMNVFPQIVVVHTVRYVDILL
jgi:hypothetical protein